MKLVLKAACTLAFLSGAAHAHDVWVIAPAQQPADRVVEADLGYSHVYPLPEAIPADRVQIFKPMEIIDSQNRANLWRAPPLSLRRIPSSTKIRMR